MRLFFVNRFFHPDHSASSQMLSDLAFALAERGHQITVITSRLSYDNQALRYPARETVRGVEVVRVATTGFGRSSLAGRAADYATFMLMAAWLLLWRLRRGDIVVTKTDPPLMSILTTPIARLRGARSINWLQDLFPEIATALGIASGRLASSAMELLRGFRDRALRKAHFNVAIGDRMAATIRSRGVASDRIRVIHNWADRRWVEPIAPQVNKLRSEWDLDGYFVVGYAGNLGRAHAVAAIEVAIEETVINVKICMSAVAVGGGRSGAPVSSPAIRWLFVGGGAQFAKLKSTVERRGNGNVVFRPYQPRERLSQSLSLPDVHLVTLRRELEGLIVPSKFYGIAAAGRPTIFIGDEDGEVARILRETGTGIVVAEGDGHALAQAIRELAGDPLRCEAMGRRARALFEANYDLSHAVEKWERAIRALDRV